MNHAKAHLWNTDSFLSSSSSRGAQPVRQIPSPGPKICGTKLVALRSPAWLQSSGIHHADVAFFLA